MTKPKIVALGDSLTFGFPFSPRESWVQIASEKLPVQFANRGVCGDTTWDMLQRLDGVLRLKPDYVMILGGSNDAIQGIVPQEVLDNIARIVQRVREAGASPILGIPIPCNSPVEEKLLEKYRERIRWFARDNNLPLADFDQALRRLAPLPAALLVDGWHPTLRGYELMAESVVETISRLLKEKNDNS